MGFIKENLMPGENIKFQTKLHWIFLFWPCLWVVLGLMMSFDRELMPLGVAILIVSIAWLLTRFPVYMTSEFAVTDRRVLVKKGIISRSSLELLLKKVEMIQADQSIMGRILGYGTIIVGGTGGTKNTFRAISAPLGLRQNVQCQIDLIQEKA
jgi:uncharacterized membrane protein YdbT with pleckstrin-like domain